MHDLNVLFSIDVIDVGISMFSSDVHPWNAPSPIYFNDIGIKNVLSDVQLAKASFSIDTINDETMICLSKEHSLKRPSSIDFTFDGISTLVSFLQQ